MPNTFAPARGRPTADTVSNRARTLNRYGTERHHPGVSAAAHPGDPGQPSDRTRAAGNLRRRNSRRGAGSGKVACRIPQGWVASKSRQQSFAIPFRSAGAAADRRRSGSRQFRADIARLGFADLGMDQPGSAADDDARLYQRGNQVDRRRQSARSPAGRRRLPDQGHQVDREYAGLTGRRRSGTGQARDLYDGTLGLWRPRQDPLCAAPATPSPGSTMCCRPKSRISTTHMSPG